MTQIASCIQDIVTPKGSYLSAQYKKSFAYHTLNVRAPVIITNFVDQLVRDKCEIIEEYGGNSKEEIKQVIGELSRLKNELQTNKQLELFKDKGTDVSLWNKFLESFPEPQYYYTTVFLYAECYLYRRIHEAINLTCSLREYDLFRKKKDDALEKSHYARIIVSKYVNEIKNKTCEDINFIENEFLKLLRLCVWGNRCDLSISAGADNSQTSDPLESLINLSDKVLVDDSLKIWKYFECLRNSFSSNCSSVIDIVLDNAGYEFFTDLCLADFLLDRKFASRIRFFVKAIPWYISDVTSRDFSHTINSLASDCDANVACLGARLRDHLNSKRFEMIIDDFWTTPYEYTRMAELSKALYSKLSEASIVIFKGDLNYRKLLADKNRNVDTEFKTALEGFLPTTVCALRTIKCDIICGLEQKKFDELNTKHEGESWMGTGEYAVIQCAFK